MIMVWGHPPPTNSEIICSFLWRYKPSLSTVSGPGIPPNYCILHDCFNLEELSHLPTFPHAKMMSEESALTWFRGTHRETLIFANTKQELPGTCRCMWDKRPSESWTWRNSAGDAPLRISPLEVLSSCQMVSTQSPMAWQTMSHWVTEDVDAILKLKSWTFEAPWVLREKHVPASMSYNPSDFFLEMTCWTMMTLMHFFKSQKFFRKRSKP